MCSDGKSTMQDFDVIISSEVHGLTIGRRGIYPAWSFSSDHKLELHESAGWVVVDTNDPPRFAFMSKEWFSPFLCHVLVDAVMSLAKIHAQLIWFVCCSRPEMMRLLSKISSIKIRGNRDCTFSREEGGIGGGGELKRNKVSLILLL
jgi:hypothetical protein